MGSLLPNPALPFSRQDETVLLAQAILGEAANQEEDARIGMASAVRNRLIHWRPEYGKRTWPGVLLKPGAFDCFTDLVDKIMNPLKHETQETWDSCYDLAERVIAGSIPDTVERSTFYFDESMDANPPYWAKSPLTEHVKDIGAFRFYRYRETPFGGVDFDANIGG